MIAKNLHDEREAEPVVCLACKKPAMLLFGKIENETLIVDDVLRVVCRDKTCRYSEVV